MVSPYGWGNDPPRGNRNNNNGRGNGGGNWWDNLGSRDWDLGTIFKMDDISEKTKEHLTRVYLALFGATGSCAAGVVLNSHLMLQGFLVMIA